MTDTTDQSAETRAERLARVKAEMAAAEARLDEQTRADHQAAADDNHADDQAARVNYVRVELHAGLDDLPLERAGR